MTKVQLSFGLASPLDDVLLARIGDAHSIYGIYRISLAPAMNAVTVEYDATRLRPAEVGAALAAAGIRVTPAAPASPSRA